MGKSCEMRNKILGTKQESKEVKKNSHGGEIRCMIKRSQ